jgi:hypothetical protein
MNLSAAEDLFQMWSKIQKACLLREQSELLVPRPTFNCPFKNTFWSLAVWYDHLG